MERGEALPVCWHHDEEEDEVAILAVTALAVAAWLQQRRRRRPARTREYRTLYKYTCSSFLLELMLPGKARIWLRFILEQICQLASLLGLNSIAYCCCYNADAELALCIVAACLSFPSR
jgi:hypothetical protein